MAFTPTRFNEIFTGDKFSCRIQGVAVTGTIHKTANNIYLCNNKKDGKGGIAEKHGHKYSWQIPCPTTANLDRCLASQTVTQFTITKSNAPKEEMAAPNKALKKAATRYKEATESIINIDDDISTAERRLAELKAKKVKREISKLPKTVLGYNVVINEVWDVATASYITKYRIGCGAVMVTKEEAAKFAKIMDELLPRIGTVNSNNNDVYTKLTEATIAASKIGGHTLTRVGK